MNLHEFIELLQTYEQEHGGSLLVVMSKDGEGNDFSPVPPSTNDTDYAISIGVYVPDSTYSGEFHSSTHAPNTLCLWPTN